MEPMVNDRETKIKFKENVVDFITPTPDISAYDVEEDEYVPEVDNQSMTSSIDHTVETNHQNTVINPVHEVSTPRSDIKVPSSYIETPRGVIESPRHSSSRSSFASGQSNDSDWTDDLSTTYSNKEKRETVVNDHIVGERKIENTLSRVETLGEDSVNSTKSEDSNNNINQLNGNSKNQTMGKLLGGDSVIKALIPVGPGFHEEDMKSPNNQQRVVDNKLNDREPNNSSKVKDEGRAEDQPKLSVHTDPKVSATMESISTEDSVIERNGEFLLQSESDLMDHGGKTTAVTDENRLHPRKSKPRPPNTPRLVPGTSLASSKDSGRPVRKVSQESSTRNSTRSSRVSSSLTKEREPQNGANSQSVIETTTETGKVGASSGKRTRTNGAVHTGKSPAERGNGSPGRESISRRRSNNMQTSLSADRTVSTPKKYNKAISVPSWKEEKDIAAEKRRSEEKARIEEQKKKDENLKFKEWKARNLELQWQRMELEREKTMEQQWKQLLEESYRRTPRTPARTVPSSSSVEPTRSRSAPSAERSPQGKSSPRGKSTPRISSQTTSEDKENSPSIGSTTTLSKTKNKEEEEKVAQRLKKRQSEAAAERIRMEQRLKKGHSESARQITASGEWMSMDEWKRTKADQLQVEITMQFAEAKYLREGTELHQLEDCDKAFNSWLKKKKVPTATLR